MIPIVIANMVTFLSILLILLTLNALLLIFSVNGAKERLKKPFRKIAESPATKLFALGQSKTEYKKAS